MPANTVDQRLAALEAELTKLRAAEETRRKAAEPPKPKPPQPIPGHFDRLAGGIDGVEHRQLEPGLSHAGSNLGAAYDCGAWSEPQIFR